MHREERRHADGDQCPQPIPRGTGDANAVEQNHPKQAQDRDASQKSLFLRDDREDEIVVRDRARQVAELGLRALRPPLARKAAAADGDQRLALVPTDAVGVILVGVDEAEDAVALVVVERRRTQVDSSNAPLSREKDLLFARM